MSSGFGRARLLPSRLGARLGRSLALPTRYSQMQTALVPRRFRVKVEANKRNRRSATALAACGSARQERRSRRRRRQDFLVFGVVFALTLTRRDDEEVVVHL